MKIGVIGLGKMGANIVRRLTRHGHECVVFNRTPEKVQQLATEGAIAAVDLPDLVRQLPSPRVIWLMLPAGEPTEQAIAQGTLAPVLSAALYSRFSSRGNDEFASKVLLAMRYQFGGHQE